MAVCEIRRWGALVRCPAGGTTSTERVNGIFLEETKRSRLAIVADLRRGHCFGGLILGGSALPLTLNADDAPGVFRSGIRPGPARTVPCANFRAEPDAVISLPFR
jgi:hypothetical protein